MNSGAVIKWLPKHEARGCLQYHVHAGLQIYIDTAEDMRHCFNGVVNLTNVCSTWGEPAIVRELSVVGPALTLSPVCTHCLSGSCDQHSGHKKMGTLLNSLVSELLRSLQVVACKGQDTSDGDSHHTYKRHVICHSRATVVLYVYAQPALFTCSAQACRYQAFLSPCEQKSMRPIHTTTQLHHWEASVREIPSVSEAPKSPFSSAAAAAHKTSLRHTCTNRPPHTTQTQLGT